MHNMKLAIIGATGMVGQTILKVLEERKFPIDELILVASEKSVGKPMLFKGETHTLVSMQDAISSNSGGRAWYGIESQYSIRDHMDFRLEFKSSATKLIPDPKSGGSKQNTAIQNKILEWLPKTTSDVLRNSVTEGIKVKFDEIKVIGQNYFSAKIEDYPELSKEDAETATES